MVFYELGICHTLGKEVIVTTQDANDVPFDIRHRRFIQYHPDRLTALKGTLQQTIQRVLVREGQRRVVAQPAHARERRARSGGRFDRRQ